MIADDTLGHAPDPRPAGGFLLTLSGVFFALSADASDGGAASERGDATAADRWELTCKDRRIGKDR